MRLSPKQSIHLFLAAGLLSGFSTSHANAQPIALPEMHRLDLQTFRPQERYPNQSIIRVRTNSQAQLDAMLKLSESVWSERVGIGLLDVQIKREYLPMLTKLAIPFEMMIEDLQAHTDANWDRIAQLDKQALEQLDHDQNQRGASVHDESWFSNYKQFADVISYFNNIAAVRPDLASMADVGDSIQSNDIYAITISGPDAPGNARADRPVVLWHGTTHAREWVGTMAVSYLASKFVDSYDTDPRVKDILDSSRIVIVPVTNPDGYLFTWSDQRFWRKNRRNNGGSIGVDINRNWGYEWGGEGASTNPSDDTYRGASAFSEPETSAIRDLALSYGDDLVAHIDYHTYSQLILWPFGYATGVITPEPDRTFYDNLATDLSNEILSFSGVFYDPIQSVDLYPAAGDSSDWFYGQLGAKSLTFELRPSSGGLDGFDPPPATILPTAQENFEAAKLFVERTTQLISLSADPIEFVSANTPTPITLTVLDGIATHDTSSATLLVRIGSSGIFIGVPMSSIGSGSYSADLPPAPCNAAIEYYFEASTTLGDTRAFPASGGSSPLIALAQEFNLIELHTMETDTGWTVGDATDTATTGVWNRMNPQATDAQPEDDHTIDGTICWVTDGNAGTGLGDRDIDGGATTLTSPNLDAIAAGDSSELIYWRWYSNNSGASPNEDSMRVEISNDIGHTWTLLELVTENTGQWTEKRFRIADFVEPTDMVRVRFIASDFGSGSIVEAGVDDLRIESVGCPINPADLNNDGTLDFFDVSAFLSAFSAQNPIADFNNDGVFNFFDVSAFLSAFSNG